jgi:hypothetical protein
MPDMSTPTISEQQILQALHAVPSASWKEVLTFLEDLQPTKVENTASLESTLAQQTWTADALQQWPRDRQDAILHEQAKSLLANRNVPPARWWSALELAKLPVGQRAIILEASAIAAAEEYETNAELTSFDAFDESDLYDSYPDASSETR